MGTKSHEVPPPTGRPHPSRARSFARRAAAQFVHNFSDRLGRRSTGRREREERAESRKRGNQGGDVEGDLSELFFARIRAKKSIARLRCCARTWNSKAEDRRQLGGGAEVSSPVRWMCLFKYTNWSLEENKRHYGNKCKTGLISVFSEVDLSILTRSLMPWIKTVMSSIFSNPCIPTSAYFPLRYLSSYKFPQTCLPSVAVRAEEVGLALWIMKFLIFKPCWF